MLTTNLMEVLAGGGAIVLGVAVIAVGARDRQPATDEHTVADYRPRLAPARRDWPLIDRQTGSRLLRPSDVAETPAPAEPAPVPWRPPYAELTVAAVVRRYGDSPADRAARMLREIAAEQRGLAVAQ